METSKLNANQKEALEFLASQDFGFASKVAKTVVANGWYSEKQANIINESGYMYDFENHLPVDINKVQDFEDYQMASRQRQMPSSMR